jgi:hypothetical protein
MMNLGWKGVISGNSRNDLQTERAIFLRLTGGLLMGVIDEMIQNGKIGILAAHDIDVAVVMGLLGDGVKGKPGFASFIAIEID